MGYSTDFSGVFHLNKTLDNETNTFLTKLTETGIDFGIDGEKFVDGNGDFGQGDDGYVLDHNASPSIQLGLCQWTPTSDGKGIEWDGNEKFYNYIEWLEYIIENVLKPKGYELTGYVQWRGESFDDVGTIVVEDNKIKIMSGKLLYEPIARKKSKRKTR